ncbi:hypothetical protein GQ457_15G019780 [Hibiscus cannabinus]
MSNDPLEAIVPFLAQAKFEYVCKIVGGVKFEWSLINALLERWKLRTHILHLVRGEATIILEDVAFHFDIPIDGHIIIGVVEGE